MKISVVIPMFNSTKTIISALNSIRRQTAFKQIVDIVVVNDGSTDNSLELVKEYAERNKELPIVVVDKANGGVSSARNAGMKAAKGEWIALLDSDDEWLPEKLEIQMRTIQTISKIDFLGGDIDENGLKILWKQVSSLYKASVKDVCIKMFPQTSTALFRKEIYEQIGGYDEKQRYAEDGNYFLKICANYNYYHLPIQMVYYGGGKPGFGFSGLSANLKEMYKGNIKNIKELKNNNNISTQFYIFLRAYYWAKYVRRIIITKMRNYK